MTSVGCELVIGLCGTGALSGAWLIEVEIGAAVGSVAGGSIWAGTLIVAIGFVPLGERGGTHLFVGGVPLRRGTFMEGCPPGGGTCGMRGGGARDGIVAPGVTCDGAGGGGMTAGCNVGGPVGRVPGRAMKSRDVGVAPRSPVVAPRMPVVEVVEFVFTAERRRGLATAGLILTGTSTRILGWGDSGIGAEVGEVFTTGESGTLVGGF